MARRDNFRYFIVRSIIVNNISIVSNVGTVCYVCQIVIGICNSIFVFCFAIKIKRKRVHKIKSKEKSIVL